MIAGTATGYHSDAESTKDIPYLNLTSELWGIFCEYLWENWLHHNGTALYFQINNILQEPFTSTVAAKLMA